MGLVNIIAMWDVARSIDGGGAALFEVRHVWKMVYRREAQSYFLIRSRAED